MKWTVLGAVLITGLLILGTLATSIEAGERFSFKGLVLEVSPNAEQVRVNETLLKITKQTKVFNREGTPANADGLKVGDRVSVIAEHKNGYDEALQIIQKRMKPKNNER